MAIIQETVTPIVFFGTGEFSLAALTGLLEASYNIVAVVTKPDSKTGRGQRITAPPVKVIAERHNIPVWQPEKLSEIKDAVQALDKPAGILSSYGKIVPQSIIDLFEYGIINIHPSLLPRYRGPSPIETAIVNGDDKSGVSIMKLIGRMDAGPVYAAKEYVLDGTETKPYLYEMLAQLGANLLLETLPHILDGSLSPLPQADEIATYTPRLDKNAAMLDPQAMNAAQAERLVRAYLGFPKTKIVIHGHTIIITKAHISNSGASQLDIRCMDGTYLSIDEVIAPSGRRMSGDEFSRGYLKRQE